MNVITILGLGIAAVALTKASWSTATVGTRGAWSALVLVGAFTAIVVPYSSHRMHRQAVDEADAEQELLCMEMAQTLDGLDGVFSNFTNQIECISRSGSCAMMAFTEGLQKIVSNVMRECLEPSLRSSCTNHHIWLPGQSVAEARAAVSAHARSLESRVRCPP